MNEANESKKTEYVVELRDNRIENTARIAFMNMCHVVVAMVGPFFIRTLMIYYMGDMYTGLNSLFISIVAVLNMAELGLAEVITFFLYDPMAKGDVEKTNHYLNSLKKVYKYIGLTVLIVGTLITPFLTYISKDEIPNDVNVYVVYITYLIATTIQYFILPEIAALADAAQRGYIVTGVNILGNLFVYALQVIAIVIFRSFMLYYVAIFLQCVFIALFRGYLKKRYFSEYTPRGEISEEEKNSLKKRVMSLLGHQMDEKFISSIDNIVISSILGFSIVTMYGNYMYVVSSLAMLLASVMSSLTASLGNAFVTEKKEGNYVRFRAVLWLNGILVSWALGCMMCMYQPFMRLWMKNRLFSFDTVILFCLYFFVSQIRRTVVVFKNANGMWWEDRYKPYVSMALNLVTDIILVKAIGINGALISSIICILLIEIPWEGKVLYQGYFGRNIWEYLGSIGNYLIFGTVIATLMYIICQRVFMDCDTGIITLLMRAVMVTAAYIFATLLLFFKSAEFRAWKDTLGILLRK